MKDFPNFDGIENTRLFGLCVAAFVAGVLSNKGGALAFKSEFVKIPVHEDLYNYVVSCVDCKLIANNWQDKIEISYSGVVYTITHEIQAVEIMAKVKPGLKA